MRYAVSLGAILGIIYVTPASSVLVRITAFWRHATTFMLMPARIIPFWANIVSGACKLSLKQTSFSRNQILQTLSGDTNRPALSSSFLVRT